jgi:hypothetical protein
MCGQRHPHVESRKRHPGYLCRNRLPGKLKMKNVLSANFSFLRFCFPLFVCSASTSAAIRFTYNTEVQERALCAPIFGLFARTTGKLPLRVRHGMFHRASKTVCRNRNARCRPCRSTGSPDNPLQVSCCRACFP